MIEVIRDRVFDELASPGADVTDPRFRQLVSNIRYLGLDPHEMEAVKVHKDTIVNRHRVTEHDAVIRFLRSDAFVADKIADLSIECLELKAMTNCFQKVRMLRSLEGKFGIQFLKADPQTTEFTKLDDQTFKLISHMFRLRRPNPQTQEQAIKLYSDLVNKITTKNLTRSSKGKLVWNLEAVKGHLDLHSFKNKTRTGYHERVYQTFGFEPVHLPTGLELGLDD